jgi:hypothetical protein
MFKTIDEKEVNYATLIEFSKVKPELLKSYWENIVDTFNL